MLFFWKQARKTPVIANSGVEFVVPVAPSAPALGAYKGMVKIEEAGASSEDLLRLLGFKLNFA